MSWGVDRSALEEVWKETHQPNLKQQLSSMVYLNVLNKMRHEYDDSTGRRVDYQEAQVHIWTGAVTNGVLHSPLSVWRDVSITHSDYWSKRDKHGFYASGDRLVLVDSFLPMRLTGSDPVAYSISKYQYARYSDLRADKAECLAQDMKLAKTILNRTDCKVQLDFVVVVKDGVDISVIESEVSNYHKHLVDAVAALPHSRPEYEVRSLLSDMFARAKIHMVKAGDRISLGQFGHK